MTDVILIDGSGWLFRAYHALPNLTAPDGTPSGAVFGMANMLKKIHQTPPKYLAFVLDVAGNTFRNEIYADYKANRPPTPDDIKAQFGLVKQMVQYLGIPLIAIAGVEADDVIGTLARQAQNAGLRCDIVTSDKDMAQLVDANTHLVDTMKDVRLDENGVLEKYGVKPDQIIDWLSLMGDSSDNIPGIPKVGPKTAANWLAEYQNLDQIIANAGKIKGKVGEYLRAHLDQLPISKQLASIRCDVVLDQNLTDLTPQKPDWAALVDFYTQMGFKGLLREAQANLKKSNSTHQNLPQAGFDFGENINQNSNLTQNNLANLTELAIKTEQFGAPELILPESIWENIVFEPWEMGLSQKFIANNISENISKKIFFDAQTTRHDCQKIWLAIEFVGADLGVCPESNQTGQPQGIAPTRFYFLGEMDASEVWADFWEFWYSDEVTTKIGMDLADFRHFLANQNHKNHLNHQNQSSDLGLLQYCWHSTQKIPSQTTPEAKLQILKQYYCAYQSSKNQTKNPEFLNIFNNIENKLADVLQQMEANGVQISPEMLADQSLDLAAEMEGLEKQAHELAGENFNLLSPNQLQNILFEKLKLPVLQKTPKGVPSTGESVLETLSEQHELPKVILAYRSASKLRSTYTDALPRQIDPKTGRIHGRFHQTVTSTGRLSSSDPNLQNIPIRTAQGRKIRQAFVAPAGCQLICADYSQIELRLMAHFSEDEGLIAAFHSGQDIHAATAAEMFADQIDPQIGVPPELRRAAKAINFGLIYGISAFGLAKQLGIKRNEADQYIQTFFARYPRVKAYMESTRQSAHIQGYVQTLIGRRLYLPELRAQHAQTRQYAERAAINAPLQGTAADLMKLAMINIQNNILKNNLEKNKNLKLILQVHDELVFEAPTEHAAELATQIAAEMENVWALRVPLKVGVGIGANWDAAHG